MKTSTIKKDKQTIQSMFNNIASKYDFLNHLLSLNIDKYWRKVLVKNIRLFASTLPDFTILDVATGTGDLAIAAAKLQRVHITGVDIAEAMLHIAEKKVKNKGLAKKISFLQADAENLPFEDARFDVVMVSYGVRNFTHLDKGLKELHRVLKPDGGLFVLEFSTPTTPVIKQLYLFYMNFLMPLIADVFSQDKGAYAYLNKSAQIFPQRNAFLKKLNEAGFNKMQYTSLSMGITCLYVSQK